MIYEKALEKLKGIVVKPVDPSIDNSWKEIKVQSTIDEGKHLTNIERKQHLYKELKSKL